MSDNQRKGRINIARYTSNMRPYSGISIELYDESSGIRVVNIELSPEQFGEAVTGLGGIECLFEIPARFDLIGTKRETKIFDIPRTNTFTLSDEEILEYLKPWSKDGWIPDISSFRNHHNRKGDIIHVRFTRYIDNNFSPVLR